jgi:hypothetical protein
MSCQFEESGNQPLTPLLQAQYLISMIHFPCQKFAPQLLWLGDKGENMNIVIIETLTHYLIVKVKQTHMACLTQWYQFVTLMKQKRKG